MSDELFNGLHEEGVVNGVILLLKEKNSTIFNMYTTRSFSRKFTNKTLIVNSCDFGKFSNSRPLYPKERTKEISKKTIKIGYYVFEPYCIERLTFEVNNKLTGIEINLMNTITDKLNIKVNYIKSKMASGNVYSNGTLTNEFVSLHKKRLDMIIGGYVLSPARTIYFIQTCPFLKQKMVWCVPHQYIYPHSLNSNLLFLFSIVIVYTILIIILWVVDRKQRPTFRLYKNVSHLIINSWGILLGKPTVLLPKSNKLRYFIILMLLFAFEINIIITSKMTTSFIKAYRVEKYDSLKKIYDHNLTTYFAENTMQYFANRETDDGVSFETIIHKETVCSNQIQCLKNVAAGTAAFFLPDDRKNYLLQFLKENETSIYCSTFIDYVYVSGIMRKGFSFTRQFNKIIGELSSAGIIDHWKREMFMDQKKEESRRLEKLSIRDIQTALYILACGYIFSFIIFSVEIYFSCTGIYYTFIK
ncbi:unnamed protein product [Psylliodes chrysocephalus]|uniref:Ionotropic receptor n=1 Tax=Psylliodes chrysocephalus TaxID=3402493 RepID=A0A9P0CK78_9CUCU|nr:unnamed protein product [Psylliodes chrysocephala]